MSTSTSISSRSSSGSTPGLRGPVSSPEVLLRSTCVVEYTVKHPVAGVPHDTGRADGGQDGNDGVLLTVYVHRCRLNPTQVRIVER